MHLDLFILLVNAALFILIWMVQLVIYPSFLYYSEEKLKEWHVRYTKRITILVLPLMLGQLLAYILLMIRGGNTMDLIELVIVLFCWLITFWKAVPLHQALETKQETLTYRSELASINWYRTLAWSLILILSLISYGK